MNFLKNIVVIIFTFLFLTETTGIVVFYSHCACTGNNQVSLFTSPATCKDYYHSHHVHIKNRGKTETSENYCHECSEHLKKCGCNAPNVKIFRLEDQVINNKIYTEDIYVTYTSLINFIVIFFINNTDWILNKKNAIKFKNIEIPPFIKLSFNFLIEINKLKIPLSN